jgi:hypothetical protein
VDQISLKRSLADSTTYGVGTAAGGWQPREAEEWDRVVTTDAVVLVMVVACARGVVRLGVVLTHWIALRARIELARIAAAAPPGTEVAEQDRRGGSWRFRSQQPWGGPRE